MKNIEKIANEIFNSFKLMSVEELLNNDIVKKAMTLSELMNRTSERSIKYKPGCTAKLKRSMPKLGRWTFSVKCTEKWSEGPYDVRFKLIKSKGKKVIDKQIEMSCNCDAWQYNGADYHALTKNYSERQYSNGESPNERDPKGTYLVCKHVAACVPILKDFIIPRKFKR